MIIEFIINTMMCNLSQMCAYKQMQDLLAQVFNLDMDATISVFTCASPLQTIKGMLIGIIDLHFGDNTSKTLSDNLHEELYTLIEYTAASSADADEENLRHSSALLIYNTLTKAASEVYKDSAIPVRIQELINMYNIT